MSLKGFIYAQYRRVAAAWVKRGLLKQSAPAHIERADWAHSLADPTAFYLDSFRYFQQRLPAEVREHRESFSQAGRGFGEDALHVMWFLLFEEFKPANFLEIGVYRGQTTSLAALLARRNGVACTVQGISPFTAAGDAVSKYRGDVDYLRDTMSNFEHFQLPAPAMLKAFSTDAGAVALIRARAWDMIYIDGNHDYDVARRDWEVCATSVKPGGVIVLDDSALGTAYRPPIFATGGHPGPSQLAREIERREFREILQVGHNRVFQKAGR